MSATTLPRTRSSAGAAGVGVIAAVAAATAIWVVAVLAGVDLTVRFGDDGARIDVTVVSVVTVALLASLVGGGLFVLLVRFATKGRAMWTVIASVVALASVGGPLSATASAATKVSLVAMHLAVAAVLIVVLRRSTRSDA